MALSTTAVRAQRFLVFAPDKSDEGAIERRLSVRLAHMEGTKAPRASGFLLLASAMLTPESVATPTAQKKQIGSMYLCEAEKIDDVKKMIESDIYFKAGVWDPEKLVILPYLASAKFPQ